MNLDKKRDDGQQPNGYNKSGAQEITIRNYIDQWRESIAKA